LHPRRRGAPRRGRVEAVVDEGRRRPRRGGAVGGARHALAAPRGGGRLLEPGRRDAHRRGRRRVGRVVPHHDPSGSPARAAAVVRVTLQEIALAVLLGGALGTGVWLVLAALPTWRAPAAVVRIGPYIRDVTDPAGTTLPRTISDPTLALAGGARSLWQRAQRRFAQLLGGTDALERRLAQAGRPVDLAAFRGRQLTW